MPGENGQSTEFRMPAEYFENNSYGDDSGKDSHNNKLKKRHKIKMMAYLVASSVAVLTVLQVNPLKALDYVKKNNNSNSNSNDVVEPVGDWGYDNDMHILKPVLENGSPNGAVTVPQYGLENVVLDEEFNTFHEVLRGGQEYRSCQLFFYKDFIVYATDSQYMENEIRSINRNTLEVNTLAKIQGSAIKGGQMGEVAYLSTTIEPIIT